MRHFRVTFSVLLILLLLTGCGGGSDSSSASADKSRIEILNVSYDPTRELYKDYNEKFATYWQKKTGQEVTIRMSHGGSGKQARAVIDGLAADVVTLALSHDIDAIAKKTAALPVNWQTQLPHNSCPYRSTIVFLVRKGNPKQIKDWGDLIRPGISVITPNPKTSGGARWNYMAAWAWSLSKELGGPNELSRLAEHPRREEAERLAQEYLKNLFRHVPILDVGARAATNTFVQNGIGDVLLAWENEALLAIEKLGSDSFQVVMPSLSILAEPPVAVMTRTVNQKGTGVVAQAYLEYLFSPEAQELLAKHHFRPVSEEVATQWDLKFPHILAVSIDSLGGWEEVNQIHFSDGGLFDQIYTDN